MASTSQPVPFLARTSSLVPGSSSLSLSLNLNTEPKLQDADYHKGIIHGGADPGYTKPPARGH